MMQIPNTCHLSSWKNTVFQVFLRLKLKRRTPCQFPAFLPAKRGRLVVSSAHFWAIASRVKRWFPALRAPLAWSMEIKRGSKLLIYSHIFPSYIRHILISYIQIYTVYICISHHITKTCVRMFAFFYMVVSHLLIWTPVDEWSCGFPDSSPCLQFSRCSHLMQCNWFFNFFEIRGLRTTCEQKRVRVKPGNPDFRGQNRGWIASCFYCGQALCVARKVQLAFKHYPSRCSNTCAGPVYIEISQTTNPKP